MAFPFFLWEPMSSKLVIGNCISACYKILIKPHSCKQSLFTNEPKGEEIQAASKHLFIWAQVLL